MTRRVVITGMGAISSLGMDASSQFEAALAARSGVRPLVFTSGAPVTTTHAATIAEPIPDHLDRTMTSMFDRVSHMAWHASLEALAQSGLSDLSEADKNRSGIFWGTGFGGAGTVEQSYDDTFLKQKGRVRPFTVIGVMANGPAALLSLKTGFNGPTLTYSTACASSAHALGEAYRQIKHGYCDRALAGGSEALIHSGPVAAWEALRTLATIDADHPERSCKPFSANRSGFMLGEGGASFVLESLEAATARGATILAELVGYGVSADAVHITKPDPQGQARAVKQALADAGITPEAIAYVNAHGTATQVGDIAETETLKLVFGEHAKRLAISSTKAIHGHTFGAAGALELLITVMAQRAGVAPPTAFLDEPDPSCDLDYVPNQPKDLEMPYAMSNSFAFGGANVALITKKYVE